MSSPEVERFEITEEDLQNEFNINRPQFRQTKHSATYGIWADPDSDDDRPGTGFGQKKNRKNFTAPMSFISGGVKVGDKVTKEEDEQKDSESEDEVEKTMSANRFATKTQARPPRAPYVPKQQQKGDSIGNWEKHTRGIGAKLLGKYGHVPGKGLGKAAQGISTPVEAFQRKGKAALGFYGAERTGRSLVDFPELKDEDEKEAETFQRQLHQWKKKDGSEKKTPKYVYKTADEIIALGKNKKSKKPQQSNKDSDGLHKVKVIDMTGKEQRVLSGYEAISHKHDQPDDDEGYITAQEKKHFDMPELLHNLDLLVDMAMDDLVDNDRKLKYEKDVEVNLTYEIEKTQAICKQEEMQISRIREILQIIDKFEAHLKPVEGSEQMTLEECGALLRNIQDNYQEEYLLYDLSALAVAVVHPLMKKEFESWNPLKEASYGLSTVKRWRGLLGTMDRVYLQDPDDMDPFDRILWEVWMPRIRVAANTWSPREPDTMTSVLEAWRSILPQWIMQSALEQLIFPRLQDEVDAWNPLTDTVPIHSWLHPWLPLMGPTLEPLYGPIRHKLANALTNWHPSDSSAKMILQPWVSVFSQAHMDAFLTKNILPKLNLCMLELAINPQHQILDPWHWVVSWIDLMPIPSLVGLLNATFFPQWMRVLCSWLSANPNFDEVTNWYMGWKSMFPEKLLREPAVADQFAKALEVMNRTVSGHGTTDARENLAYLSARRPFETSSERREPEGASVRNRTSIPTSFREMIEKRAEENNLEFLPIPNRTYEAKQVYRFGHLTVYMDRNVVFMNEKGQWVPVSLNTLVDRGR